ncbi:MAG: type II secretion system F family protein [Acidobacteriota bacterium]|nr:type II secretion system F family protein [Acidobacteriota bacterium]
MFFLFAFLIFSAALFGTAWYIWSVPQQEDSRVLAGRLRELRTQSRSKSRQAPDLLRREKRGNFAVLGDFANWIGILRRLQQWIQQANLKYRAADVFALSLALAIGSYFLMGIFGVHLFLLRLLFAALLGYAPIFYIRRMRARRLKKFEENLPDAIDLFTRTMRAGHNIHSGLETISTETSDPIRMEFRKIMEELALGSPIEAALHSLGERIPLIDLKFFITGLILQRQTGANMVSVLENLSTLVRERLNMAAKMKAHTAQQRFSAGLLCLMPIVVGIGFWILKPDYIALLYTDPTGSKFLTYAIVSEIVGILIIRKLANVKA